MLDSDHDQMDLLTRDLGDNKSAKIRKLKGKGYRQADIARFLGISDQFVSNVVRNAERQGEEVKNALGPSRSISSELATEPAKLTLGPGGRVVIPSAMRQAMEISEGDTLLAWVDGGELTLVGTDRAMRNAQNLVRAIVPKDRNLVDELIAERRREAELEDSDG